MEIGSGYTTLVRPILNLIPLKFNHPAAKKKAKPNEKEKISDTYLLGSLFSNIVWTGSMRNNRGMRFSNPLFYHPDLWGAYSYKRFRIACEIPTLRYSRIQRMISSFLPSRISSHILGQYRTRVESIHEPIKTNV